MTKCMACFKELGKKEILFTEDKQPYCINPFTCNDVHPNSVANIVARGGAVRMFTEEELETNIFERFNVSDAMKERVIKVAQKPQSIRLSKYDIAFYLLQLQATKNLSSISESVRYCVNLAMQMEPIDTPVDSLPADESSEDIVEVTKGVSEAHTGGIKVVIPDMPKSINVDWSKLPPAEKIEDEEDTF